MQNHYNLLYREEEREMAPSAATRGSAMIPWSPLARGRLARSASPPSDDVAIADRPLREAALRSSGDADARVLERARRGGEGARSAARAGRARVAAPADRASTAPIVGATKMQHLEDAVAALVVKLSDEEARQLEEPYVPHAVAGF